MGGLRALAVLVCLLVAGAFLLRIGGRDTPETRAVAEDAGASPTEARELEVSSEAATPEASAPLRSISSMDEPKRPGDEVAASTEAASVRRIRGRVIVEDVHGALHASENGRFELEWGKPDRQSIERVIIRRGAFEFDDPRPEGEDSSLSFHGFILADSPAVLLGATSNNSELVLHVRWQKMLVLRARSAFDGTELAEFCVEEPWKATTGLENPCEKPRHARPSPYEHELAAPGHLKFRSLSGPNDVLFIGAPGHAWLRFVVQDGGEHVVTLEPGGILDVRLGWNLSRGPGAFLRVRRKSDPSSLVHESSLAEKELHGLPLEDFLIRAELGEASRPIVLASNEARPVTGGPIVVELHSYEDRRSVRFEGTLELPTAWKLDDFELELALEDSVGIENPALLTLSRKRTTVPVSGSPLHQWRATLVPGRYVARIRSLGFAQPFEVLPSTRHVVVSVPPP